MSVINVDTFAAATRVEFVNNEVELKFGHNAINIKTDAEMTINNFTLHYNIATPNMILELSFGTLHLSFIMVIHSIYEFKGERYVKYEPAINKISIHAPISNMSEMTIILINECAKRIDISPTLTAIEPNEKKLLAIPFDYESHLTGTVMPYRIMNRFIANKKMYTQSDTQRPSGHVLLPDYRIVFQLQIK